ncbi:MAG TPA: hypothetical protein VNZ55_05585 [Thermomicrobiales bacterium]|nr:hypothetical protein [Thermomicrobiales bacterium]
MRQSPSHTVRRAVSILLAVVLMMTTFTAGVARGQTPASGADLGSGPSSDQLTWLLDVINTGASDLTEDEVEQHFDIDVNGTPVAHAEPVQGDFIAPQQ